MAHIVQFRSGLARTEPECEVTPQEGAQIIIFPGVRRERHPEPQSKLRRRDKARPKRDRLELPD
jgi:hypothetical protein